MNRHYRLSILVGILAVLLVATNFFIRIPSANQDNTVTLESGGNIAGAINQVGNGGTVILDTGSYRAFAVNGKNNVTIKAKNSEEYVRTKDPSLLPTVEGGGNGGNTINITNSPNTILDGLKVVNAPFRGISITRSDGTIVRNSIVRGSTQQGIFSNESSNLVIENNRVHGTKGEHGIYLSNDHNNGHIIRGNDLYNNGFSQLQLNNLHQPITRFIVENNTIHDGAFAFSCGGCQDGIIRNNVIYNGSKGITFWGGDGGNAVKNIKFYNNTLVGHNSRSLFWEGNVSTIDIKNNIALGGGTDVRNGSNNITSGDASSLFVNANAGDFHLKPTATNAIDKGTALSDVTLDFEGTSRPQGGSYDIGADELGSTSAVTPTPTPPSVTPAPTATPSPSGSLTVELSTSPKVLRPGEEGILTFTYINSTSKSFGVGKITQTLPPGFVTLDGRSSITINLGSIRPGSRESTQVKIKLGSSVGSATPTPTPIAIGTPTPTPRVTASPIPTPTPTSRVTPTARPSSTPTATVAPTPRTTASNKFVFIGAQALLNSPLPPNWVVDQLGATDAIVFWDLPGDKDLYSSAATQEAIMSYTKQIRQKLGDRVGFWPSWWSFNDAEWHGTTSNSPDFHLAGAWNNDAKWQIHYRNLRYMSRALAETHADGVFLDLENYGDTPNANGGFMQGAAWKDSPLVQQRAKDWWGALTSSWHGKPGFYVHWQDGRRFNALKQWCQAIFQANNGGYFLFEDSFSSTVNNRDFQSVSSSIKTAFGQNVNAYAGLWLTPTSVGRVNSDIPKALNETGGLWLFDLRSQLPMSPSMISSLAPTLRRR